ncbi:glutamine amidotransferase [Desulfobacula sp.]|uniref:glutamine amidotransferase n=1 Tax=Desulfobacula sp. TaxID=2593537 RepID=UPI0025C43E1E|nr:glutamine amidotransferase [Desulfobacula sp.]
MRKLVIIKTGDTFPAIAGPLGDFEDWISQGLSIGKENIQVVDVTKGETLPAVEVCKGVVIAGSHAMVTQNFSWSVAIEQWVPDLIQSDIPIFGICYGHQLLAKAMGGVVDYHAGGLEIGTTRIELVQEGASDKLFKGLPKTFTVHVCHSQTVVRLPDTAVRIAKNSFEPNHAFRIGQSVWGVQFHPEYDDRIMAAYAENMETMIKESGLILSEILDKIEPTPMALRILKRFGKLVG